MAGDLDEGTRTPDARDEDPMHCEERDAGDWPSQARPEARWPSPASMEAAAGAGAGGDDGQVEGRVW